MHAPDSGIGPEEVTAALESMILDLNQLEDDWLEKKGAITPEIHVIKSEDVEAEGDPVEDQQQQSQDTVGIDVNVKLLTRSGTNSSISASTLSNRDPNSIRSTPVGSPESSPQTM